MVPILAVAPGLPDDPGAACRSRRRPHSDTSRTRLRSGSGRGNPDRPRRSRGGRNRRPPRARDRGSGRRAVRSARLVTVLPYGVRSRMTGRARPPAGRSARPIDVGGKADPVPHRHHYVDFERDVVARVGLGRAPGTGEPEREERQQAGELPAGYSGRRDPRRFRMLEGRRHPCYSPPADNCFCRQMLSGLSTYSP